MKISGNIFEGVSLAKGDASNVFLRDEKNYYLLINNQLNKIFKNKYKASIATIVSDGIWIADKSRNITEFQDVYNLDKTYESILSAVSNIRIFDRFLIANTNGVRKSNLIMIDTKNYESIEKEFTKGLRFNFDDRFVFTRSNNEKDIECFTLKLDKIWEYTNLEGQAYLEFELKPQIHNDLLIINHAWDTIALNKHTGKEVWKYTFEAIPTSNVLMQGKVYAVCQTILYAINPDNGEVEWTKETGCEEYLPSSGSLSRNINNIGIFPVGDYFYGVARWAERGEIIRLYDKELNLLYKTRLVDYYINPYLSIQPTIHEGKIYQTVRNAYSYSDSGILVLEITENESEAGIRVAPRPDVTMMASPSLQEKHKLQIFLEAENLDDALRYGELLTQELQYTTGYITTYNERVNAFDSQHNGVIELIIDDSEFDDPDKDKYLKSLEEKLIASINTDPRRAGDKKTFNQFNLIKMPRKDWDMNGQKLDWPAIRDQKEPLS